MLIAEELLLLAVDDESGRRLLGSDKLPTALGGALIVELALTERIAITGPEAGRLKKDRLSVINADPTDDAELDRVLQIIAAKPGKRPQDYISGTFPGASVIKKLDERLLTRLVERGVLGEEKGKVLGVFPTTRWPARDTTSEREVRGRLWNTLVNATPPSTRTVALVALLSAIGFLPKVLPEADQKALKRRAKELSEGDWASAAVKRAIDETTAMMTTVVVVSSAGS